MIKQKDKRVSIKIPIDLNCSACEIVSGSVFMNCTQTYKECRHFHKGLWGQIDKQLRDARKKIFKDVLTFDPFKK